MECNTLECNYRLRGTGLKKSGFLQKCCTPMYAGRSVAVQCVSFQNKNDDLTLNGGSVISNHFKPRLISNRHVIFQLQNST